MSNFNLRTIIVTVVSCVGCTIASAAPLGYQVTFNVSADLQNVFVYGDEFNGAVYAWDLTPAALGAVNAGISTFQLGNHDLRAWAVLATHSPSGVATSINNALAPGGMSFESVFPGAMESTVESNIVTLYVGGAYNTPQAFFLTEFVLAQEDTLKTDFPIESVHMYTFSNGVNVGTATFSPVLPGDYNHNGIVDAADYTVWRDGLGSTFTQSDYTVWKANFGNHSGSGASANAAVPEPATVWLLVTGILALCSRRRSAVT
jgi:hypothetical protein